MRWKLHRLSSDVQGFKTVEFKPGLNLVVAEQGDESVDTDTRNGVGKSTMFQIIDFCLGGTVRDGEPLARLSGDDWSFKLELRGPDSQSLIIVRYLDDSTRVEVSGDLAAEVAGLDDEIGEFASAEVSLKQLKTALARLVFGLGEDDTAESYSPSFRSLFTHACRWRTSAFESPFLAFSKEQVWQLQVNNAYLLGLNWRLASERQVLRERAKRISVVGKLEDENVGHEIATLDSKVVLLRAQAAKLDRQLENFSVLEEYRDVEARANRATKELQELANDQSMSARLIEMYQEELAEQRPVSVEEVRTVYGEMQVALPDAVVRTLHEVEAFHQRLTGNRRDYLQGEVRQLEQDSADRDARMEVLSGERSRDLELLTANGALDELSILQKRAAELASEVVETQGRLEQLRLVRSGKAKLDRDLREWGERNTLDLDERREFIDDVVVKFSEIFQDLYAADAVLVIEATTAGFVFREQLPRQGSHGVEKIAVLAYDLALAARQGSHLPFVLHDSLIFDGVDERQKAKAIAFADRVCRESGLQYIIALNSDDIPYSRLARLGIDVETITSLVLTDESDSSGLLGRRYR